MKPREPAHARSVVPAIRDRRITFTYEVYVHLFHHELLQSDFQDAPTGDSKMSARWDETEARTEPQLEPMSPDGRGPGMVPGPRSG